jgi:hypothetical protein
MGRIPISITKIKVDNSLRSLQSEVSETIAYLFTLEENGQQWQKTFVCDRKDLLELRADLDKLIEETSTAEVLQISKNNAKIVDEHYRTDELCQGCTYKLTHKCKECLFILQSPLERKLYLELSKSYLNFQTQYPLNWLGQNISIEGKTYGDIQNNFKEVLTVVDFYIEKRQTKLCIYTDGHSYHERTEEQAIRDRSIDRKLQELGFVVLRYPGKEVKENPAKIINEIKKRLE